MRPCALVALLAPCLALRRDLLNTCLDARHHKSAPGPEDALHNQCSPWRERSCCTSNTSHALHLQHLSYSFDYDHCQAKQRMSEKCRRHFTQDHCFYECSPNLGPWTVQEGSRSWRSERFHGAPLCPGDCEAWFNDCRYDFTCTDNWARNFDWKTVQHGPDSKGLGKGCPPDASCRVNVCPYGASCRTFEEVFGAAHNFCNKVWDGSWSVHDRSVPCLRLWFDGSAGNPNDAIARFYVSGAASQGAGAALLWLSAAATLRL